MRTIILVAAALALSIHPTLTQEKEEKGCGRSKTASIEVSSAKCEMCADKITEALEAVHGVQSADVDLEKKVATVQYCPSCVSITKLEKAITDAGYNANKRDRNSKAYDQLPSCCK